jgi:hypothetical protein
VIRTAHAGNALASAFSAGQEGLSAFDFEKHNIEAKNQKINCKTSDIDAYY